MEDFIRTMTLKAIAAASCPRRAHLAAWRVVLMFRGIHRGESQKGTREENPGISFRLGETIIHRAAERNFEMTESGPRPPIKIMNGKVRFGRD